MRNLVLPRIVAALGITTLAVLLPAAAASAHDRLVATDPADGSRISSVPKTVSLTYNEAVLAVGSRVQVVGPDGDISAGKPRVTDNVVKVPIGDVAPAGKYTVTWRVTSSDGHPIAGSFTFTARKPAGTPPGTPSPAPGGEAVATPSGAPVSASASPGPVAAQNTSSDTDGGLGGVAVIGAGVVVLLLLMALTFLIRRMRTR